VSVTDTFRPAPAPPPASSGNYFSHELGPDGVLVVTLDVRGEKMNVLSKAMVEEFGALLTDVETRAGVKGVVIRSGKPDNFVAGADIKDFTKIRSALEGEALSRSGQLMLNRLEALPMPTVAAIHGTCLGGGTELALSCRYRIASDDPKTALGLPEVMLGLLPGAGGSNRMPRLVGLATGLDLILTGRSLKAARALKAGLVDEVVPAPALLTAARRAVLALADGTLKPKRPGIRPQETLLRPFIFRKARASVMEKTGGHYPAPLRAIDVIERATATSLAEGLKIEAAAFGELAVSDVSRALVSVFFATTEIKKDAGYPEGTAARPVKKLAVVGAGLMGAGIATVASEAGSQVRLKDNSLDAIGRGLKYARDVYDEKRKRRSLTGLEVGKRMDRISGGVDYSGFRRADLLIEAVFEDLELKRRVLAETETLIPEECVWASNTSSLPIGDIAKGASRPERVLGMHFFSPVHKMPLLEVIVTPETSAFATATAVTFGRAIGKHVIVVRDGPGFYTTRVLAPYMNEAARVVEEGASVEAVDAALSKFGFPVGPVTLLDEVGIDVGAKVSKILHHAFGERLAPPASMARVLEDGRQGRKNAKGFFRYENGKKAGVDTSVYDLLPGGAARRPVEEREVQDRLVFQFLNEAVLCLQDGILRSPRDGDIGAIFGLGFPPFLGGPFRYLDRLGARFAVEVLEKLRERHGERFRPAPLLVDMARDGRSFHTA
jgi:3-hydroxyacyl-CoA dehydrogenase/enoyl-CoA hydratase/3-hydroxybutyryl-CoA epimerase